MIESPRLILVDMTLEFSFMLGPDAILRFAELTGDRNPLHLDAEFARRSRYRESVAHGMLVFSYLYYLQGEFAGHRVTFRKLTGQFLLPIFVNEEIRCFLGWNQASAVQ